MGFAKHGLCSTRPLFICMIQIYFYPGSHGHFVEFVLNKIMFGDKILLDSPFTVGGTSHGLRENKNYQDHRYFQRFAVDTISINKIEYNNFPVIKINVTADDTLLVTQLNLKRAEDFDVDVETLTENTYFKLLGKKIYNGLGPEKLINDINSYSDISPYNNIKDPAWPNILTVDDFWNLPQDIINECANVYKFVPFELSEKRPNAPRWALRSVFKTWFDDDNALSFHLMKKVMFKNMYSVNLNSLYNLKTFKEEVDNVEQFLQLTFPYKHLIDDLHSKFINKVPYLNSKTNCNTVIRAVRDQKNIPIKLNVLEEGYVNHCLEKEFKVEMPLNDDAYFINTQQIISYINKNEIQDYQT